MTRWRSDRTLASSADRREATTGDPAMTDRIVETETITDDGVERRETLRKDYVAGAPSHGDEEAGGAVGGGIVGGPVGAVVGGAIGAATGATAGAIDEKSKDDEVVVKREERPL